VLYVICALNSQHCFVAECGHAYKLLHVGSGRYLKHCYAHDAVLRKDLPTVLAAPEEAPPAIEEASVGVPGARGPWWSGLQLQIGDISAGGTNQLVAPDQQNAIGATAQHRGRKQQSVLQWEQGSTVAPSSTLASGKRNRHSKQSGQRKVRGR
jgi:hypothetical protein